MYRKTTLQTKQRLHGQGLAWNGGREGQDILIQAGKKERGEGQQEVSLVTARWDYNVGIDTTTLILTRRGLGPLSSLAAVPALGQERWANKNKIYEPAWHSSGAV